MGKSEGWLVDTQAGRMTRSARSGRDERLIVSASVRKSREWEYWAFVESGDLIAHASGRRETVEDCCLMIENIYNWPLDRERVQCL